MSSKIGDYDHLNREDNLEISINIEEVASKIQKMNFGTHRFLSALVRSRRKNTRAEACHSCKMLTDGIEQLLNDGGF